MTFPALLSILFAPVLVHAFGLGEVSFSEFMLGIGLTLLPFSAPTGFVLALLYRKYQGSQLAQRTLFIRKVLIIVGAIVAAPLIIYPFY